MCVGVQWWWWWWCVCVCVHVCVWHSDISGNLACTLISRWLSASRIVSYSLASQLVFHR